MKTSKKTSERKKKTGKHETSTGAFCTQNSNSGNGNGASDSGLRASGKHGAGGATGTSPSAKHDAGGATGTSPSAKHDAGGAIGTSPSAKHDAGGQSQAALPEVHRVVDRSTGLTPEALASGDEALLASLEAQMAAIEAQIAGLRASEDRLRASDFRLQEEVSKTNPEAGSPKPEVRPSLTPEARAQLATPVITAVTPVGSHFLRVSWNPVADADSYLIQRSTGSAFTANVQNMTVDSSVTSTIIGELGPDTLYYFRVKAVATGTNTDSEFSPSKSARTGLAGDDETVTHLQSWFAELQTVTRNFATLLPQLDTTELTTADRMRLLGSGVRRYGFIEKTADVAGDFPQIWPGIVEDTGKLRELVGEIEVLRSLLVWSRWCSRVVQDLLLIAGDDAFRLAGAYYAAARDGARRKNPEAVQVFDMLRLFWRRPRRITEEPTEKELMRDAKALIRGTKEGEIVIKNESDQIVKGEKVIIDNTQSAK